MNPLPRPHFPLRILVVAAEADRNLAVARYASSMARCLGRAGDDVFLAITPRGWAVPLAPDDPVHFSAWHAPALPSGPARLRRHERIEAAVYEAARDLVRSVHPEVVVFVAGHPGHAAPLHAGIGASGTPAAVVVLNPARSSSVTEARRLFVKRHAWAQQWVTLTAAGQRVLARRFACPPEALEVALEGVPVAPAVPARGARAQRRAAREALGLPADAPLVVAEGPLEAESGCEDWARAVSSITEAFPEVHFVWQGDGSLREEVAAIAARSPGADHIQFLSREAAVPPLLPAADLAVYPRRLPAPGLAPAHAMAWGVPVVATAVDPVPELIRPMREGLICAKAHPEALAEAIAFALGSSSTMRAMAQAAYLRVQDYSEERAVERLRPIIERLSVLRGAVRPPS